MWASLCRPNFGPTTTSAVWQERMCFDELICTPFPLFEPVPLTSSLPEEGFCATRKTCISLGCCYSSYATGSFECGDGGVGKSRRSPSQRLAWFYLSHEGGKLPGLPKISIAACCCNGISRRRIRITIRQDETTGAVIGSLACSPLQ